MHTTCVQPASESNHPRDEVPSLVCVGKFRDKIYMRLGKDVGTWAADAGFRRAVTPTLSRLAVMDPAAWILQHGSYCDRCSVTGLGVVPRGAVIFALAPEDTALAAAHASPRFTPSSILARAMGSTGPSAGSQRNWWTRTRIVHKPADTQLGISR